MRANVMKIYLGVTVITVCLAAIVVIGAIYGVNQEIKEIQYQYEGSSEGGTEQELSVQAKSENMDNNKNKTK